MELADYLKIVRARWIGIVLFTLLGLTAASGWTLTQPRQYTADASAIVTTGASADIGSALVGDNYAKSRVRSYLNIAESRQVAGYAAERLGLQSSLDSLIARVNVSNPSDTAVLQVAATWTSPEGARDLAEAWIQGMIDYVSVLENDSTAPGASTESIVRLQSLDSAVLPGAPSSPNVRLALALGVLVGLALGIAYAVLRSILDRRVRDTAAIERETGLPVLGMLPSSKLLETSDRRIPNPTLDATRASDHRLEESLRELRTNLQFMNVDDPPRVLVVTSSLPGEGKSTVAANLAVTLAESEQRVVLVDGDLRRPTVASSFGVLSDVGLTDVLVGRVALDDALQPYGRSRRLWLLAAGSIPPNPSELLGSRLMGQLLAELSREAIVIIDAPPLLPVTDAAILTARTDGALLVASSGRTTFEGLGRAIAALERVQGRPLGVILNRVPLRGVDSNYYGTGYRADRYYVADEETGGRRVTDLDLANWREAEKAESETRNAAGRTAAEPTAPRASA